MSLLYTHSDGPEQQVSEEPANQAELFTRIDPTKLHGALDNAMKLGTMEVSVCTCVVITFLYCYFSSLPFCTNE